ncbi:MAG TPA: putative sulfate exporter family transporter [Jatrophihabitans sp.]|jgi:uncharacterized integral membrane protein (TIGR00698 family)
MTATADRPVTNQWPTPSPVRLAVPGLLLCAAIAAVATAGGELAPVVGAPVLAIMTGVVLRLALGDAAALRPGVRAAQGVVLPLAVVVLGAQLSITEIVQVGYGALPVMLGTLAACLAVAHVVGRRLGIETDLRTLIGVGTAICGASAIAAVSPVIKARSNVIAYALSTIFLFNVAAVLIFPPLGHALGLSQTDFGLFAGTAVNDTSSVVAAASAYGSAAADHAVVVKLVRTLMIIPICIGLAVLVRRRDAAAAPVGHRAPVRPLRLVPWFLVGFVLVAAANSLGLIPIGAHAALSHVALWLITTALAGVGLSTDLAALRRTGPKPMLLGLLLWITVAGTSLLLQWATV